MAKGRLQKKKKKFMTNVILGGGLDVKMSYNIKLCLKSISSHSESFWKKKFWVENGGYPNTQPFFTDSSNLITFVIFFFFFLKASLIADFDKSSI